jgi:hypothetical protein
MEDSVGFTVTKTKYEKAELYYFNFTEKPNDKDFSKFLAILDKLLDLKNPFVMIIDTSLAKSVPVKASISLTSWMKKRKADIPGILLGSSVVMNNKIVISLVNMAFSIQKPTSPNILTSDYTKALSFIETKCPIGKKL